MIRFRDMLLLVVLGFYILAGTNAEEECLLGKTYWCYDCDSYSDSRCKDPWNHSIPISEHPPQKPCEGCCVKIVRNYATPKEQVTRTCTKNIEINLFMVDHVCMYEGHQVGHMCFCEGDRCNSAPSLRSPSLLMTTSVLLASLFNLL